DLPTQPAPRAKRSLPMIAAAPATAKKHTIVLIPGDGIGPEVTAATKRIVDASGVSIDWLEMPAGVSALEQGHTDVLPALTLDAIRAHKVALKGPIGTPVGKGFRSVNVQLRKSLTLYAA